MDSSEEEILLDFLESENSSEASVEEENVSLLSTIITATIVKNERVAIINFFEKTVPQYNEDDFLMHFRIRRAVMFDLAENFRNSRHFNLEITGSTPAEKQICIFVWFVGHEAESYRNTANQFNIAIATAHLVIERVANFLVDLAPRVIKWPNVEDQNQIADYYMREKGFPNVAGCIDGTHIIINRPLVEIPDSYINRKGDYSIQMQIICDNKRIIRDIFIGYPGSVHDSRVFCESSAIEKCVELANNTKYILGDSAYPCLEFLLTPYKDNGFLQRNQKVFNKRLSSCRVHVEHTIGMLKQRFRQLYHSKTRNIPRLLNQIKACCVLHNLCSQEDFHILGEPTIEEETIENAEDVMERFGNARMRGKILRDLICESL